MVNAGEVVRASDVVAQGCRLTRTTTLSCGDGATVTVGFDSEVDDPTGMHDTVTNNSRITFAVAGWYHVGWQGAFPLGADYIYCRYQIDLNGADTISLTLFSGTSANVTQQGGTSTVYWFDVGDYIEAKVEQNNTANTARSLQIVSSWSPTFYAARIGS